MTQTAERLAMKIAQRHQVQAMQAPPQIGEGARFMHQITVIGTAAPETCTIFLDRTAMHDDCKIAYGICPHGLMGWRDLTRPRVRANREQRRR